jgi:N-acetylglucosaminyl-diphospho-decaprenol L-rhamnosyltransferase
MISVLIVNYNGKHLLRDCIDSVLVHAPADTEIIVHDNGSSDSSVAFLEQFFPTVQLSRSSENLGFVGGNNAAARLATGDHLLLLNSDTIVRNSLDPMIDLLEGEPTAWVVGCRLIYGDGKLQESIGQRLGPLGLALSWSPLARWFSSLRRTLPRNSPLYEEEAIDCDWVSGACLLTSSARWYMLGGLDERYFMYMEDVDYCEQVHRAGGKIYYTSATVVTHFEGAGRPWIGRRAVLNTANSYTIYARKFYGITGRVLIGLLLPPMWWLRAGGHGLLHLIGKDEYGLEKAAAFLRAGFVVLLGRCARNF